MPAEIVPTEDEIAVHWREESRIDPPPSFSDHAQIRDPALREQLDPSRGPDGFRAYADLLTWDRPYDRVLDDSNPPFYRWFTGGSLNASVNAIDRHLPGAANRVAFHFVPEDESAPIEAITYGELSGKVNRLARLLQDRFALTAGDRVTLYLPMVPELPIAMLACARLGVIHSVVFSGFSGKAAGERIVDSTSRFLITMDGYFRNGQWIDLKAQADQAARESRARNHSLEGVLVFERTPGRYQSTSRIRAPEEIALTPLLETTSGDPCPPVSRESNDGLFIMYSSGTTGRPKGCFHGTGGYLSWVGATTRYVLDLRPDDVYWCMADIGWITGHSYIVYGPLSLGTTSVMYEGVPTYPDPGRAWRIAERLGVNIFHTAPTTIRMLRKVGPTEPKKYDYHFKHMTTVGEPIEPDVWRWYYEVVGKREAVIVDTWWQTENGGFLCSTLPGLEPMKPGSAGPGVLGIYPVIYDENGEEVPKGSGRACNICIRNPWPGIFQTIWGDPDRFVATYYQKYNKDPKSTDWHDWPYFANDGATEAPDGYFRILGRVDDVINVAGHRLGTKELESAAILVDEVAEAAAVPVVDELRGRAVEMYVSLKPGVAATPEVEEKVCKVIETEIGKVARPKNVWIVPDMPKTRSGKIMRRVIAGISNFTDVGDITTLANPEVVDEIRAHVHEVKQSKGEVPKELSEKEAEEIKAFGQAE